MLRNIPLFVPDRSLPERTATGLKEERKKAEEILELVGLKDMAESLGVSKQTLLNLRNAGAPWLSIGGKVFYHGELFMEWLLKNRLRSSEAE